MKEMIQVHKTTSELRNILVQVITDPAAPWQVVAPAGELVALDVRFDEWFLRVAKPSLGEQALEMLLSVSDEVTDSVERAWRSRHDAGWDALRQSLEVALAKLGEAMKPAPGK